MKKKFCVLIVLLDLLFIIGATIIINKYYNNVYRIMSITRLGIISIFLGSICLTNYKPRILKKSLKNIFLIISCTFTVAIYILFFLFLPKYTVQDAYTIITSDSRFISDSITPSKGVCITYKHKNPFAGYGYTFLWEHNGTSKEIYFDPIDGTIYLWE